MREGKQTPLDCQKLENLNYTNISDWQFEPIKLYTKNIPAYKANDDALSKLPADKYYLIKAIDLPKGIPESEKISNTGNLPHSLRVCIGARFMLTINIDTEDHLVNGSIGTIENISMSNSDPLRGTLYIKFDNPKAGNALKNNRINPNWVPIVAVVQSFRCGNINYQRKQFPGILAHAITIHKAQGSTFEYMMGYLEDAKRMVKRPGMMYTLLSRAKTRSGIKLQGFESDMIVTNESALVEMKRMRKEKLFHFQDPTSFIDSPILLLLNIVSWNLHISHHFNDQFYLNKCSIMCFTETNVANVDNIAQINDFHYDWKDYHSPTEHGLAICYKKEIIDLIEKLPITFQLEGMACILKNQSGSFIVFLIYRKNNTNIQNFFEQLIYQLREFASYKIRIILLGDFNLDPWKDNNNSYYNQLSNEFGFHMKSDFSTHIHSGALDIILDTNLEINKLEWLPTPFSDHFYIFYGI